MIVLDASAAAAILFNSKEGEALRSLIEVDEKIISSELFKAEMSSVICQYVAHELVDAKNAMHLAQAAFDLIDEFVPIHENILESLSEAIRQNHSVYDMLYLTLARRNAATLFSLDKKLIKICEDMHIDCISLLELG